MAVLNSTRRPQDLLATDLQRGMQVEQSCRYGCTFFAPRSRYILPAPPQRTLTTSSQVKTLTAAVAGKRIACFLELATELQLEIWKLCLVGPRIIMLTCSRDYRRILVRQSTPTVLHICARSRGLALKYYKLGIDPNHSTSEKAKAHNFYINPDIDTIYVPDMFYRKRSQWALHNFLTSSIRPIHRLAINIGTCDLFWSAAGQIYFALPRRFPIPHYLEEFVVTMHPGSMDCEQLSFQGPLEPRASVDVVADTTGDQKWRGYSLWKGSGSLREIEIEDVLGCDTGRRGQIVTMLEDAVRLALRGLAPQQSSVSDFEKYRSPKVEFKMLVRG